MEAELSKPIPGDSLQSPALHVLASVEQRPHQSPMVLLSQASASFLALPKKSWRLAVNPLA